MCAHKRPKGTFGFICCMYFIEVFYFLCILIIAAPQLNFNSILLFLLFITINYYLCYNTNAKYVYD